MRNILAFGTMAVVLAVGAANAYANGPDASPYLLLDWQSTQQPSTTLEGRAAYVGGDQNCYPAHVRIHGAWHNVQVCD